MRDIVYMPDEEDKKNAVRLAKYGFLKKGDGWPKEPEEREKKAKDEGEDKLIKEGIVDMEIMEYRAGEFIRTSYPAPNTRHVLSVGDPNYAVLEKSYLWILNHITLDWKFTKTIKVVDTFGSSTGSQHWSIMNDKIGNVQRNINSIMQTIGGLVKELFPMVHELRIWDERLRWHEESEKGNRSGDMALKGAWMDLVDGGADNASSVLGLASKVGFATLPDLFFGTFVQKPEDIDKEIDSLEFGNMQVKNVLKRKLMQFLTWKDHTRTEIIQRKRFTVRYLRQHINAIQLQMSWLTPYLRQLKYLRQNTNFQDSAQLISSFDNSKFELETLCTKKSDDEFKPVVLLNFQYLTVPERVGSYQHPGFQHAGNMTVTFRGYVWTDDQIKNYQEMRNEEGFEILGEIDAGFKASMDELKDEIRAYIEEAGGTLPETDSEKTLRELQEKLKKYEEGEEKKKPSESEMGGAIYQPFIDVAKAFGEIGSLFVPKKILDFKLPDNKALELENKKKEMKKGAEKQANIAIKNAFINYRKAHRMVTW